MITEQDLQAAIAECRGDPDPDSRTCIKLAAFLIIQDHLYPSGEVVTPTYSFSAPPADEVETTVEFESDTEFSQAVNGKKASEVWAVIDELMEVLRVTNPRLYKGVIRKIEY